MSTSRQLYRSETDRLLGGVCGGLAEHLGVDATIVRVVFLLVGILGGGLLLYPAMWVIVPTQSRVGQEPGETVRDGMQEIRSRLPGAGKRRP